MMSGTNRDGKWNDVPGDENINANGRKGGINGQTSKSSYADQRRGLSLSDLTMIYKDGQEVSDQKPHRNGYPSSLAPKPVCEGRDGMTEESETGQTSSNGITQTPDDEHPTLRPERKDTDYSVWPDQSSENGTGHQDTYAPEGEADPLDAVQRSLSNGETTEANGPREPIPRRAEKVLKLSSARMEELMSSPDWTPVGPVLFDRDRNLQTVDPDASLRTLRSALDRIENDSRRSIHGVKTVRNSSAKQQGKREIHLDNPLEFTASSENSSISAPRHRDPTAPRADSPVRPRRDSADNGRLAQTRVPSHSKQDRSSPGRIDIETRGALVPPEISDPMFSPMPQSIPLPPFSLPTYLQLELSSNRPSPLYIHRSATADFPYESSRVKLERLQNFLLLPPALEQVLWFGTLTCLDSWLYSFTILPLRFFKALYILLESWAINVSAETQFVSGFVVKGIGRVWRRKRRRSVTVNSHSEQKGTEGSSQSRNPSMTIQDGSLLSPGAKRRSESLPETGRRPRPTLGHKHRRQKSIPSSLLPEDKADILRGFLMISTCIILMRFDASRMYHWIRGQAAIKLYVIYNVLEVSDRLLSAIGQDVLECLFSREALERKPDGRSKVFRPFWLFVLALIYTVIHAMSLFYQVITLNVAVNSYSNALITLLLSNQFVEIKSTVFKKFEKENLFQLTCADVVERFQLWLMLTIIASRNIVETGIFSSWGSLTTGFGGPAPASTPLSTPPRTSSSILPQSFTLFPSSLLASLSGANSMLPTIGQVLGPFLVVLGSEMLVDWLKHAYINKFNNIRPAIYGRFLDVLAKDYYTNAFADQNITRRLGLPVISLSCLFFRVSVQTYQMFLSAWLPQHPSPTPNTTSLSSIQKHYSPSPSPSPTPFTLETAIPWSVDRLTALFSSAVANAVPSPARSVTVFTVIFILTGYVILLLFKLALGILLLSFARSRYRAMKDREREQSLRSANNPASQPQNSAHTGSSSTASYGRGYVVEGGRRVGGWGVVEVDDEKNRWIYSDDPDGLRKLKERGQRDKNGKDSVLNFDSVRRYDMVAKRIW